MCRIITIAIFLLVGFVVVVNGEEMPNRKGAIYGHQTNGIALSIAMDKRTYRLGKEMVVKTIIKNTGKKAYRYSTGHASSAYNYLVFDRQGRPVAKPKEAAGAISSDGYQLLFTNLIFDIKTNATQEEEEILNTWCNITKPGKYYVVASYCLGTDTGEIAYSNMTTFTVVK